MSFKDIKREILKSFNKISYNLHKNLYDYITKWIEILEVKFSEYFS